MIVPDPTFTGSIGMIHAPITALIVGGHHIGGSNGKRGQVPTPLPFQDHEGGRPLLEQSIQAIEGEHPNPRPLGGKVLVTPTGEIVLDLMVGMKLLAVIRRGRFKRQTHALCVSDDRHASWPSRIIDGMTHPSVTSI